MKKKMIHLPTPFAHIAPIHNRIPLFHKLSIVKICPKVAVQEKKATLGGIFERHTCFHGKRMPGVEEK